MEKLLTNFRDLTLSREQMKNVKGGVWCYGATCECGDTTFAVQPGDLQNYISTVQYICKDKGPVSCSGWEPC